VNNLLGCSFHLPTLGEFGNNRSAADFVKDEGNNWGNQEEWHTGTWQQDTFHGGIFIRAAIDVT
jgi:hypothetical protein